MHLFPVVSREAIDFSHRPLRAWCSDMVSWIGQVDPEFWRARATGRIRLVRLPPSSHTSQYHQVVEKVVELSISQTFCPPIDDWISDCQIRKVVRPERINSE